MYTSTSLQQSKKFTVKPKRDEHCMKTEQRHLTAVERRTEAVEIRSLLLDLQWLHSLFNIQIERWTVIVAFILFTIC